MSYEHQREIMVETQIEKRGITDDRILEAMREVERHKFIDNEFANIAYQDTPLPIGSGQTISQPFIVALMTQLLDVRDNHKVLEVGTGSGYQSAILSKLAMTVVSVERIPELYRKSKDLLQNLEYNNIIVVEGDGSIGYREYSPYDRIMVTASSPNTPESLIEQLTEQGIMVIPVGNKISQQLIVITKKGEKIIKERSEPVRFVPLLGKEAW